MAPDTTPRQWPAEERGLLDDMMAGMRTALRRSRPASAHTPPTARPGRERPEAPGLELRTDLALLGENLTGRLLRDIGLGDEAPHIARLQQAGQAVATVDSKQEEVMAREDTPKEWPSERRGMLDDAGAAAGCAGVFRRLARFFVDALRDHGPQTGPGSSRPPVLGGSGGQMSATLEKGQCLSLDGSLCATVECLAGAAWITCPAEGKDVALRAGETARIKSPVNMVVAALGGPARIRMGWR